VASARILALEFTDFLAAFIPVTIAQLLAALAGSYYLRKITYNKRTRYLVWFLWVTFFIEVIAAYAPIAFFSEYKFFSFVDNTPFSANYWLYNCFLPLGFVFFAYYFRTYIKAKQSRLIIKITSVAYLASTVVNLLLTDVFFIGFSQYTNVSGTLLIFLAVVLFYFELLRSDILLRLKQFLPLYISIGVLIFNLCATPVDLFSDYFSPENNIFIKLRVNVLMYANIFMYLTFTLGFIVCSRKKRSS